MISAVIITKNEESNIKDCLESLCFVDEIIIIDSHSTDKTVEIARNYTDKIFTQDWLGFGLTKNFGIDKAKNNWILSIDADERITNELRDEILAASLNKKYSAYKIPRLLYFAKQPIRYGGCYPDYQIRLFQKDKARFNDVPVHENLIVDGKIAKLKHYMEHFSYDSISQYWDRFNRYTSLDAVKKYNNNKKFKNTSVLVLFWELFKRLILKLGILDGFPGIFYHIFSSISPVVKYAKLWELEN